MSIPGLNSNLFTEEIQRQRQARAQGQDGDQGVVGNPTGTPAAATGIDGVFGDDSFAMKLNANPELMEELRNLIEDQLGLADNALDKFKGEDLALLVAYLMQQSQQRGGNAPQAGQFRGNMGGHAGIGGGGGCV